MTAPLGEDADAASLFQPFKHSFIHRRLVDMWRNTELCPLIRVAMSAVLCLLTSELLVGHWPSECLFQPDFGRANNLLDLCVRRFVVDCGQSKQTTDHEHGIFEVRVDTFDQGGITVRIRQVYLPLRCLLDIQSSTNRDRAHETSGTTNEGALHALGSDQPVDAALYILAQDAHKDERVNELIGMGGSDDDERALFGNLPGTSRVNLTEEELDYDAEDGEKGVVDEIAPAALCDAPSHGCRLAGERGQELIAGKGW